MASRVKEDEKNERTIRSLLKLPDNKRCINCNSLGPQYVCITFWTFVCTNCSGIHREFTHRVKSISMAKFTSQEVISLQEGGNQRARDIYFKGMDQKQQSLPDGSNVERLRDFIRHVYVNKRYADEKNDEKPPRGQMDNKNDYNETQSSVGSRSPPYEDANDHRYSARSSPGGRSSGGRSPGLEPSSRKFGDIKNSPSRPEILNDWRREDRFGGRNKSEEMSQSPEQVKDLGSASPPVVRPVREILGDSVIPLRVGEPPKPPVKQNTDDSAHTKTAASSSGLTATIEKPPELKLQTLASLIDFDADPVPLAPPNSIQAPRSTTPQPVTEPATTTSDNWACFDAVPSVSSVNMSQSPPSVNTVDSLLSQLAVTSSVPVQTSTLSTGPVHHGQSTSLNFAPSPNVNPSEQTWNTAFESNEQRSKSAPPLQPLQGVPSGGLHSSEVKPPGRKELPADLFTMTYPSYQAAMPGWQSGPSHGMQHFGMQQYYNTMPFQNIPQQAKSINPFDFSTGQPSQETMFPSMGYQQGGLPPSGMMIPSQGVHNHFNMPSQFPGHPSTMPPRYISPQIPGNMPRGNIRPTGNMGAPYDTQPHSSGSPYASTNPSNPPFSSTRGNPFG